MQEIFDVALLPGMRYPEIAEEGSDAASSELDSFCRMRKKAKKKPSV